MRHSFAEYEQMVQMLRGCVAQCGGRTLNRAHVGTHQVAIELAGDSGEIDLVALQQLTGACVVRVVEGMVYFDWKVPEPKPEPKRDENQQRYIRLDNRPLTAPKAGPRRRKTVVKSFLYGPDRVVYGD